MPGVFFYGLDPHDETLDLLALVVDLLTNGDRQIVAGGVVVADSDGKRSANRARQQRLRNRRRVTRNADEGVTRNADENENNGAENGSITLPRSERPGGEGNSLERNASNARNGNGRVTRDGNAAAEPVTLPPLTDEQREQGRERIRELGDALREIRGQS